MVKNHCDTHGLDIPCKKCSEERMEESKYLEKIREGLLEKGRKGE